MKIFTNWKDLVDLPEVQIVIIATPPSSHAEITAYALEKKKKVIVEKPFSLNLDEAYRSAELANKTKTHLYFAYHAAFNPASLLAKDTISKILSQGDKISSFKVIYKEDVRNYHGNNSWIFEPEIAGGGCLIDSGINAISTIYNIGVGPVIPTKVHLGFDPRYKVEISAHVQFVSKSNPQLTGELIQDWLHQGEEKRECTVVFTSGKCVIFDFAKGVFIVDGKSEKLEDIAKRSSVDIHGTLMGYEYINIVKDALVEFKKDNYVDPIGVGPFESIMLCYKMAKKSKL